MARRWVAAIGTAVYTTNDPTGTWTVNATGLANTATANPLPIRHGRGFWTIAPGSSAGGNFFYSPTSDGTWTKKATGAAATKFVYVVEQGGGYWVAIHNSGTGEAVYTATDPSGTWSTASSGATSALSVAYLNETWLVGCGVGGGGTLYATNPTGAWSTATGVSTNFGGFAWDYSGATYAVCGDDIANLKQYVWYSDTLGGTWTATAGGITTNGVNPRGLSFGTASNGSAYWVLATFQGNAYYATTPSGTWTLGTAPGITGINAIKYADGLWLAMGQDAGGKSVLRYTRDPTGSWSTPTSFPNLAGYPSIDVSGSGIPRSVASKTAAVNRSSL